MWLNLARWFEWFFGVAMLSTITVITSLNYLDNFGRWALLVGLLLFFIATVIVQFDKAGWFRHE
jgi:hypothetical protein